MKEHEDGKPERWKTRSRNYRYNVQNMGSTMEI